MHRRLLGVPCGLAALVLALGLTVHARAGQDSPQREIQALGDITGDDALKVHLQTLLKEQEKAKKLVAAGLRLLKDKKQPLAYNAAYLLGQAAGELKDVKTCESFFRVCIDQAITLHSSQKLLQSYGGLIDYLYENRKYADVVRVCRELLELKPAGAGQPRVYFIAFSNRFGDTDFDEVDTYDLARGLRPSVHRIQIRALAKDGKADQALRLIDNLIAAEDHWNNHELKGAVLREAGRYNEAVRVYEDVLERIVKDKTLGKEERHRFEDRVNYILSNVYVDLKQIDKASEKLKALVAKKPDEPAYQNDLGYIWADHGMNLQEAEKLVRNALELDRKRRKANPMITPEEDHDNGAYLDSLGWVLFKQKKYKEAKEVLLKAVEDKNAQHIEIYDHLAEVHMMLGEREAAIAAWRRGLEVVGDGLRELQRKTEVEKKLAKYKAP